MSLIDVYIRLEKCALRHIMPSALGISPVPGDVRF